MHQSKTRLWSRAVISLLAAAKANAVEMALLFAATAAPTCPGDGSDENKMKGPSMSLLLMKTPKTKYGHVFFFFFFFFGGHRTDAATVDSGSCIAFGLGI